MKKNIILISMFILLFLFGNNSVYAEFNFKTACTDKNELYQKYNGNVCRYLHRNTSSIILLYYDENSSEIYWRLSSDGIGKIIVNGGARTLRDHGYDLYYNNIYGISDCPSYLPVYTIGSSGDSHNKVYASIDELLNDNVSDYISEADVKEKIDYGYQYYSCFQTGDDEDEEVEINCNNIFTTDVKKYVNLALNIIRIGVPILLICLITYDLFMAVLANDEKKVNDVKSKIIKRLIIAVAIFFVSTLINFVFNLVNESLGTKYEICDLNDNKSE